MRLYHVTSARNRESISAHGLDPDRMGAAVGIAGSEVPEQDGVFVCLSEFDAEFFVRMNNTGGPVDVWCVDGIDVGRLVTTASGFSYLPGRIPPGALTLLERSPDGSEGRSGHRMARGEGPAYRSRLTITMDDGTVLSDEQVRDLVDRAATDG